MSDGNNLHPQHRSIIALLADRPGLTRQEIADALGLKYQQVGGIPWLEMRGLVKHTGRAPQRWYHVAKGEPADAD